MLVKLKYQHQGKEQVTIVESGRGFDAYRLIIESLPHDDGPIQIFEPRNSGGAASGLKESALRLGLSEADAAHFAVGRDGGDVDAWRTILGPNASENAIREAARGRDSSYPTETPGRQLHEAHALLDIYNAVVQAVEEQVGAAMTDISVFYDGTTVYAVSETFSQRTWKVTEDAEDGLPMVELGDPVQVEQVFQPVESNRGRVIGQVTASGRSSGSLHERTNNAITRQNRQLRG